MKKHPEIKKRTRRRKGKFWCAICLSEEAEEIYGSPFAEVANLANLAAIDIDNNFTSGVGNVIYEDDIPPTVIETGVLSYGND